MNVLHINRNYVGTLLHQTMIRHLDGCVNNTVFAPISYQEDTSKRSFAKEEHVTACFGSLDRPFFFRKQKKILSALMNTVDIVDYDLIHAYTLFTDGYCAKRVSDITGRPFIVAVRSTDINSFFKKRPYLSSTGYEILRDASAVIFLSEAYRKELIDGILPEAMRDDISAKSYIIPNGIDDWWFSDIPNETDYRQRCERVFRRHPRVMVAGRINRNKNQELAARAIGHLNSGGYHCQLLMVGPIEDARYARKLKRYDSVAIIPEQDKLSLKRLYRTSDVFLLPSHKETFGLVYAEALSQGLPVLYTEGQGFDSQFESGFIGYPIDSHNVDSVVSALQEVFKNYEAISSRCVQSAQKYRWSGIIDRYRTIYDSVSS